MTTTVYDDDGEVTAVQDALGGWTKYTYNALGQQTSVTDPLGRTTTYQYDAAGDMIASTDPLGRTTTYTYDVMGRQTSMTDPLGNKTTTTYDKDGNVLTATDADGNETAYVYDADGRVTTTTEAVGTLLQRSTTDVYDADGNLISETDPLGRTTTYGYDKDNRQTSVTDPLGHTTTTAYDALGNVISMTDARGYTTTYQYDALNRPTSATDPLNNQTVTAYDANGNVTSVTDGAGDATAYQYDGLGQLTETTDALGHGTATSYDADGNVLTTTDANGNVTHYAYDADGELTSTTDALGHTTTYQYDRDGEVTSVTDPDGNQTAYTYDLDGRMLSETTTDPAGRLISSEAYSYDPAGNVSTTTDGVGNVVADTYNAAEQLVSEITRDAAGQVVASQSYGYDLDGEVTTTTDGDGNVTIEVYDADGQVLSEATTDPQSRVISSASAAYDANGNVLTSTDGDRNVTTNTYDADNQLLTTQMKDPAGLLINAESFSYDGAGRVLTTTDGAGDVTLNVYDADGQLTSTTVGYGTAAAAKTSYTYDANGNVLSETDPDGNVTSYTYNANGNVLTTTTPIGVTTNTYDAAANLLTTVDADGRKIVNTYDGNQLTGATWYNADGSVNNVFSYTYDADGELLTATDDAGAVTMTYDGGRLMTRTDPFGMTLTYGYDQAGNVTSEADSLGGLTTMTYDGNQMSSLTYQDATTHLASYFAYDGDGNVLSISRYSYVSGVPQLVATTGYVYDGGEVTSITTQDVAGDVLQSDLYSYDAAGRLASQDDDGVTTVFGYDATSQLLSDGSTSYSYDANGNRTIAGYVTGTDNELTSDGTWNYTYDAEGNTVQKVNIATGETWTYSYNLNNRLVSAVDKQADGTLIQQATYEYDALGDRIQDSATVSGVTTTTNYAFDAAGNVWADLDGTNGNALETRRLFLNEADEVFARIGQGGAAWYLTDHEGSVVDVVDNTGAVLDHRAYDAFGNITSETAPTQGDRYGYDGGELDSVTGLSYFDNRYLNSPTGGWTSQDPLGLGPDSNPYRYVGNDPTDATDPSGLYKVLTRTERPDGGVALYREESGKPGGAEQFFEGVVPVVGWFTFEFRVAYLADQAGKSSQYIGDLKPNGSTIYRDGVSTNVDVSVVGNNINDDSIKDWGKWLQQKQGEQNFRDHSSAASIASGGDPDPAMDRMVDGLNLPYNAGNANGRGSGNMQSRAQAVIQVGKDAADSSRRDLIILTGSITLGGALGMASAVNSTKGAAGGKVLTLADVQGTSPKVGNFKGLNGLKPSEVIERIPKDWAVEVSENGDGFVFRPPGAAGKFNHVRIMVGTNGPYVRVLVNGGYVDDAGVTISGTSTPNKAAEGHTPLAWE